MSISCTALRSAILTSFFFPLGHGDAVRPIALNFAWTERHWHSCKTLAIAGSQHVPVYNLQQFPSYSNRKCKKSPFSRTAAHIFVSPGDAPAIITQYVAWMERQFNACQTPRSICTYLYLTVSELYEYDALVNA